MPYIVNGLAKVLSPQVKAEVFRLLFGVRHARLPLREPARQSVFIAGHRPAFPIKPSHVV
jgi:hypothetical protein